MFNLYLSDFPDIFDESCALVSINDEKLNCLMFADDVVLLSESSEGLQNCLNRLSKYCAKWQLTINLSKTKVVIFNKGGHRIKKFGFTLNDGDLSVEQMYTSLGIPFTSNGSFKQACVSLNDKAKKAFFVLRQINPRYNVSLSIKLFQALIMPILSYGSEVWGPFIAQKACETNLNIKLCKHILGVNKHATNVAVRGELGRYPVLMSIIYQSLHFYLHTISVSSHNLVYHTCTKQGSWFRLVNEIITKLCPTQLTAASQKNSQQYFPKNSQQ